MKRLFIKSIFGEKYNIGDNVLSKIIFYIHNKRPSRLAKFGHLDVIKYEYEKDYKFPSVCIDYALENDDLEMTKYFYNIHGLIPSKHSISRAYRNGSLTTLRWLLEMNRKLISDSWIYVYAIEKDEFTQPNDVLSKMIERGVQPDIHSVLKTIEKEDPVVFGWFLKKIPKICCEDVVVHMIWNNPIFKQIFKAVMFN